MLGVWTIWEPNALDGLDAQYANTPFHDASGRFIPSWNRVGSDLVHTATGGLDAPYYTVPLSTGKETVLEPYYYNVGGTDTLMSCVVEPIKHNGTTVGVVGVDIEFNMMETLRSAIKPFDSNIVAIVSNSCITVANFDPNFIGKSILDADWIAPFRDQVSDAVRTGQSYRYAVSTSARGPEHVFVTPLTIGTSDTPWSIIAAVPHAVLMRTLFSMIRTSVIIVLLVLAAVSACFLVLARSISRPIARCKDALKNLSEGDLTVTLNVTSKDETGELAHYFNQAMERLRALIDAIAGQSEKLSGIGDGLALHMDKTGSSVRAIDHTIDTIQDKVQRQSQSVDAANTSIAALTEGIARMTETINAQAGQVDQSSAAIKRMIDNIQAVATTLEQNVASVNEL
jgi:methyl-accepting chemotaxis protein